jgi:hypothetical protein
MILKVQALNKSIILFLASLLFSTEAFSKTYKITETGEHKNREEACKRALINSKVMAIEEHGVTISSTFTSRKEVNSEDFSSSQKQNIIQSSKNHIRLISYNEKVSRKGGNHICKVDAVLSIGDLKQIETIPADKIKDYNQKYIKTCSIVTGVYTSKGRGKPTFVNFGRSYPNQIFSAVIWKNNIKNFSYDPTTKLLNKKICIKGEVKIYRDKPSINLTHETQIEF